MNFVIYDQPDLRTALLPLTFTRPVGALRVGIYTIAEKWQRCLQGTTSWLTQPYLQPLFPRNEAGHSVFINGAVCPTPQLAAWVQVLSPGEGITKNGMVVAIRPENPVRHPEEIEAAMARSLQEFSGPLDILLNPTDIFGLNASQIRADFELATANAVNQGIRDKYTVVYGEDNVFVEEGASIRAAIINAEDGPVYIGRGAQVQEGAMIHSTFALCEGAVVNMGGKMRGDSTIGPYSKVGGEVSNSVVQGFSNKGHDGFMGNSVLGEWCNLGADTNTSNLKNNYRNVAIHHYGQDAAVDTGKLFCGLIMGDHSKAGINTMFNTGTVVGVGANIFGGGFPPKHIPSFAWGGADSDWQLHKFEQFLATEQRVLARRKKELSPLYHDLLLHLHQTLGAKVEMIG